MTVFREETAFHRVRLLLMRGASVSSAHHLSMGVPVPVPAPIIESALFQDSITVKKLRPVKGRSSSLRFTTCYIVPGMARGIPAPVRSQNGIRAVGILSSWMIRFPVTWECRAKATCRDVGRFFVLRLPCGQPPPFGFCPACSEVIFPVPLLAPVFHPHRLAVAFLEIASAPGNGIISGIEAISRIGTIPRISIIPRIGTILWYSYCLRHGISSLMLL